MPKPAAVEDFRANSLLIRLDLDNRLYIRYCCYRWPIGFFARKHIDSERSGKGNNLGASFACGLPSSPERSVATGRLLRGTNQPTGIVRQPGQVTAALWTNNDPGR